MKLMLKRVVFELSLGRSN